MSVRITRTYYAITLLFNLAMSLIWGVDTLFKLDAGLDIFQVMLTNAAFTAGSMVFEIPTGVVADTVGRRVSLLLCLATLFVTTLLYVSAAWRGWGFAAFMWISVFLGLGYTFYTGAVDAWLVDALKATGYTQPLEPVFARAQMLFGLGMLIGTITGGLIGQIHLYVPYLVRAAVVLPLFVLAWVGMREVGFTPRALELRRVPAEMRRVFVEGLDYGLHHRVVRPVMLASLVTMTFMIFGFYSWQKYFLDLLGRNLVWVNGVVSSLVGLALIGGNALVSPAARIVGTRTGVDRQHHRPVGHGGGVRCAGTGRARSRHVLHRGRALSRICPGARCGHAGEAGLSECAHSVGAARDDYLPRFVFWEPGRCRWSDHLGLSCADA